MTFTTVFFVATLLFTIIGALYALSARQLMRGVLGLALFFTGLALLFAQFGAYYLAVGQLFLFVGGVVTLFVLAFNATRTPVQHSTSLIGVGAALAVLAVLGLFLPEFNERTIPVLGIQEFGMIFFTQYGWILNITLLLLLSAIIGAQYIMEEQA